ncbi:amino acid permease, partial [Pseudomonas syringae]
TLVAIALSFTSTLTILAETVVLLLLFVFLSVNVAVLVLKRDKVEAGHFQVHWVIPVLGILSCVLLLTQQGAQTWLRAGILLVVGTVLYGLTRLGSSALASHPR